MLVPFSVVPSPRFSYSLYAYVFAWADWLSSLCCAYFASQTPSLCSASILVPFPFCTHLFVLSVCFALQTPGLCSASIFGSLPLLHTFICFVSVLRLANTGFVQCFYLRFPLPLHTFICFVSVLRLAKHRVCAVLLSSVPSLFVLNVKKIPLHTFICFVSELRLANTGFVQCFYLRFPSPFAHVYLFCQCASPRKHRVCVALPFCTHLFMSVCFASQTPGLCCAVSSLPYKFVRFYALFVLYNRFCVAHFALQASGLLGPKPKFLFGFVVF